MTSKALFRAPEEAWHMRTFLSMLHSLLLPMPRTLSVSGLVLFVFALGVVCPQFAFSAASGYGVQYHELPSSYTPPPGAVVINPNSSSPAVYTPVRVYENAPEPDPEPALEPAPQQSRSAAKPKAVSPQKPATPKQALPAQKPSAKAALPKQAPPASKSPAKAAAPLPASPQKTPAAPAPLSASLKATPAAPVSAPQPTAASRVLENMRVSTPAGSGAVQACWVPLMQRLQSDLTALPEISVYFQNLPEYSPDPMGTKVRELFRNAFMSKPKGTGTGTPSGPPSRIYRSVVTAANVEKCNAFLAQHKATFDAVEKKYPVPRRIIVSLLMVETRLGTYIGKENAFWSLACMALADRPELVRNGIGDIPLKEEHGAWLQAKLTDKSNWAYKELRALVQYCSVQRLDPHSMPGSVYGAIGICQFMPSNLVPYGDDGDGDGVVNLFSVPDAIFSAAKYLTRFGWGADISVAKQRTVLKRYNNLNIYANTILALGESINTGVLQTGPPDAPKVAAKPSAAPKGKSAAKSKAVGKDKAVAKKAAPAKGKPVKKTQ